MNSTYRSTLWLVAKPAPDWNGTAVVGDSPAFKELKLSDFKGIEYMGGYPTHMYVGF